jgi:hypothetical protein
MKQLVIMPGGFHPFHAGHAALYQSAVDAFPGADVFVAATNDTSARPFPFPVKEKLAQLAGVPKGRFTQVKSPFRAEEIVHKYDPNNTQLIFVRSEKDAGSQPRPGGTKKDGTPSYLQPYNDASDQPLSQRAYMTYLPTVEFGPGMTSATEIRGAWPRLNEKRKTALIMSLYPKTQTNPKLAATVVKLLDTAMGVVDESALDNLPRPNKRNQFKSLHKQRKQRGLDEVDAQNFVGGMTAGYQRRENQPVSEGPFVQRIMHPGKVSIYVRSGKVPKLVATDIPYEILDRYIAKVIAKYPQFKPSDFSFESSDKVSENQGWAATLENTTPNPRVDLTPNYPNYATLVGEFIGVKKNRALFRIISAELRPGQGETEKIFRAMSTNTPIGVEIGKVKNRAVLEALKPDAFAALQQAKQNIEQNRQQEVDQWEQDFRANSAKLAGQQLKQRFAAPPPAPIPVAQPGEGYYALKDRLAQLDIAKQKFEDFNKLIASIKKKYPLVADTLDQLENSLLQDVKDGAADNYVSLLTKLSKYETALTTRFPGIVKEDPDYINEASRT